MTLAPDRALRALSIPLLTFFSLPLVTLKCKKKAPIMEKPEPIRTYVDSKFTSSGYRSNSTCPIDSTNQLFILSVGSPPKLPKTTTN